MLRVSVFVVCSVICICSAVSADDKVTAVKDANRLAYLDECNPWYPDRDFPKLITPQWVGEEGVEAVIVLAIDDMRDPAKYELYLRPILNRLKQIDGRAPVSIMTCDVKPDDPQLQSWLGEGLSIECHTIDHPCPILQGGDFDKAKSTYDRCVDLMGQIPGNKPVAFRTPCCDSLNTVSPRFFSEIFNSTTKDGKFLQIDSSVFTFFTSEDESLPKELVLDANGKERFWKYLPKNNNYGGNVHNNFVNYIKNYPYPYVINNSCWEIPCIAPSDWSAQHLHGVNNPVTVEDWKAAIDLTVHKQGCFSLVFHPHGWISPEQVVEMIDHAVAKHGKKVKFLNFREVAKKLNTATSNAVALRMTTDRSPFFPKSRASTYVDLPKEIGDIINNAQSETIRPIQRENGTNNGFFIHDRHFCWINEDTATLPDLMYRVSFDEILAEHKQVSASGGLQPAGTTTANALEEATYRGADAVPLAAYEPVPVGAAVVDITPDYPVRLTGYGNRLKESDGVAAKIHARALVIGQNSASGGRQPAGTTTANAAENATYRGADAAPLTILITIDNCGVPIEITETVFAKMAEKYGLARERFAISSTHTHSGPWLRGFAPNIFADIPDDHAAHLAQYETDLIEKLVEVVDKAIAARRPGHLSYGFGEAGFAMNRRALTNGKWSGFGEVPDGPTDKRVPVLAAHDVDGKLIAVLANYACHCTTETGEFNQISGDWAGFAADMLEAEHPGAVALIAIGCGADANPSPRGTHEQAKVHGKTMADEVKRLLRSEPTAPAAGEEPKESQESPPAASAVGSMRRINPDILCNMARIDLPLGPIPTRAEWEELAKRPGVEGSRAKYFLNMLDEGHEIPTTIPNYPVQTWCFGEDLAMVFLGGEVVVDYSIRMNDMFDGDRLWINAYSNDVPCYIASARVLREGGYECDSSMLYYRQPTRLAPEAEDVLCDAVQKIMPHEFYSEKLQQDFPAPKSPEDSLKTMTTKPDLRIVLAASEPLIRDPVAFDWDERGRLWVVEMGDYPKGPNVAVTLRRDEPTAAARDSVTPDAESRIADQTRVALADESETVGAHHAERDGYIGGRIRMLEDTDKDGVYDKATTFLDNLAFPNGIHCWRGGVIVTMAPEIFYAEDTDGDGKADVREIMYKGFVEGNQQHRVNGLRWGLDGWLYLANGDSGGEIAGTGFIPASGGRQPSGTPAANRTEGLTPFARQSTSLRGRDLRFNPDTNELDTVSGQTQFGRERDDFGNWFGNNNSNPIYQYVLEDRYVRRNPRAGISQVTAQVSVIPGAAPVYPTSRTLARFNDFAFANRFTSACSTMIYRDNYLGEQYYGNAFTSEPVHNLVSRLVLTREGYGFKGERPADEQESEFLASSDNWFRPTMIRTGPDGAIWVADMYRAVIEHPEWIPPEYQRKMNLYAGNDRGRIYRIVPASECCGETSASGGRQPTGTPTANRTGGLTPNRAPVLNAEPDLRPPASGVLTSLVAGRGEAAKSFPAERTYFDQPWNEIPKADLVKRLESLNGWWRDLAQRILMHQYDELLDDTTTIEGIRNLANSTHSSAVSVQAMAMLNAVARDADRLKACFFKGIENESPNVRREAVELLESLLRAGDLDAIAKLTAIAADPDLGVRLQLILSLGEAKGDSGAKLLGQMMRENFDDLTLRNAGLTSLTPENISGVLNEALNVPADQLNEGLIGILLGQAAAMGNDDTLGEPLTQLVKSIDDAAPSSRFDLIAEVLRKTLRSDAASKLKLLPEFKTTLKNAGETAMVVARNALAEPDRRAAALRFADVVGVVDPASESFADYLEPQTPTVVQIAAVNSIVRHANEAVIKRLLSNFNSFAPAVRSEVLALLLQRESTIETMLDAVADETLTDSDFDATELDAMLNHRNHKISARAKSLLSGDSVSSRAAIIDDFKSQIANLKSEISNEARIAAGKLVFEKRCGTCHKLQDIGKDIGADLAALKDRSTDALLTAVLDPNRAVESKFLTYTVVTKDGLQYSGMLKGETGGGLTLIGSEGKEFTVARADIDELVASKRSLMPEGLEKDLSAHDLANVIAFVQSNGTAWKGFEGNSPQFVKANPDGTITLPASAAEIYGPSLLFEEKYGNLGFWTSTDDYTKWTFEVPKSGHWTVEFDFACDDSTAGSLVKLSTGNRLLSARVPGSGTWDHYQTWQAGTIDLHRGRGQLIVTAPEKPPMALMDLRAIRLIPPK